LGIKKRIVLKIDGGQSAACFVTYTLITLSFRHNTQPNMLNTSVDIFLKLVQQAYAGLKGYAQEHDFFKTATNDYIAGL